MATLKEILESAMKQMIDAQRAADAYSVSMADEYKEKGLLAGFEVPAVRLSGVDLEFRYAVKPDQEKVMSLLQIDPRRRIVLMQKLSARLAKRIIDRFVEIIQESGVSYLPEFDYIDALPENERFRRFFARRINEYLSEIGESFITDDLEFNVREIDRKVDFALIFLVDHDSVDDIYRLEGGKQLRWEILETLQSEIIELVDEIISDFDPRSLFSRSSNAEDVTINAEELAALPESSVQKAVFHLDYEIMDKKVSE